jgi:hypothetical protein
MILLLLLWYTHYYFGIHFMYINIDLFFSIRMNNDFLSFNFSTQMKWPVRESLKCYGSFAAVRSIQSRFRTVVLLTIAYAGPLIIAAIAPSRQSYSPRTGYDYFPRFLGR